MNPPASDLPERPTIDGLEPKWADRWDELGVYAFDRTRQRAEIFSTTEVTRVSGS